MTNNSNIQSEEEFRHFVIEKLMIIEKKITKIKGGTNRPSRPIDNSEFCRMFFITDRTALEWRRTGKVRYFKSGKKIYYRPEEVEQLMKQPPKKKSDKNARRTKNTPASKHSPEKRSPVKKSARR